MLSIAQIQDQILSLSEADYCQLRQWFYDQDLFATAAKV